MDDEVAASWALRLERAPLSDREQAELENWLNGDARRHGQLLRAEATLAYLDRGRALASPAEDHPEADMRPTQRRYRFAAGLASLAIACFALFLFLQPRPLEIETELGEVRSVALTDGSVASINTSSRVEVAMRDGQREVNLKDGEVWFKVAHDKTRPFIVAAGDVRVRAIGTAFSVRMREEGADVLVTEGVVETWIVGHESEKRRIEAGSKGFVEAENPKIEVVSASQDIDRALAWRNREVALNGESLQFAVAEINRYNVRKLVIDDPEIARESLVGYFRVDQPESFGREVARMMDARVTVEGNNIRISKLTR